MVAQAPPEKGTSTLDRHVAGLCYHWGAFASKWPRCISLAIVHVLWWSGRDASGHCLLWRRRW